jgi:hypothetical protein
MTRSHFRTHAVLVPLALSASSLAHSQQPTPVQSLQYPAQAGYAQPGTPPAAYPPPQPVYAPQTAAPGGNAVAAPTYASPTLQNPGTPPPPGAPSPGAAPQAESYRQHEDTRHGHDQVYPDRGAILKDLPRGANVYNYAGSSYWFADAVWFEPRGPAFMVIAPPIGLVVTSLPSSATAVVSAGRPYLYANDVYYRPRPDLGGYEVVNDPVEPASEPTAPNPGYTSVGVPVTPIATALPNATVAPAGAPGFAPAAAPAMTLAAVATPANSPAAPSPDQQARDRYECYRFAVTQTGFDPLRTAGTLAGAQYAERQSAYERAQAACFEGRGYSVR